MTKIFFISSFLVLLINSSTSHAAHFYATLIPAEPTDNVIQGLVFEREYFDIEDDNPDGDLVYVAEVEGKFGKKGWTLLLNRRRINLDGAEGGFVISVNLTGRITNVELVAVGPKGELEKQKVSILFHDFPRLKAQAHGMLGHKPGTYVGPRFRSWHYSLGSALSFTTYEDHRKISVDQTSITLKGNVSKHFRDSPWQASIGVFANLIPLYKKSTDGTRASYYGFNFRGGYTLFPTKVVEKIAIHAGWYIWEIHSSNKIHKARVFGPQLFALTEKKFKFSAYPILVYFKYAPLSRSNSLPSLSNYEIAGGGVLPFVKIYRKYLLGFTLDFSYLRADFPGIFIRHTSTSAGLSLAL